MFNLNGVAWDELAAATRRARACVDGRRRHVNRWGEGLDYAYSDAVLVITLDYAAAVLLISIQYSICNAVVVVTI